MQKFIFNEELSKIVDFYRLPDFGPIKDANYDSVYKKVKQNKYMSLVAKFYEDHKEFKEKNYEMIYGGLRPFTIFNILTYEEILDAKTIDEVKAKMLSKSEEELRRSIVSGILGENDNAAEYLDDAIKLFLLLDDNIKDDRIKGKFAKAIAKPYDALNEYLDYLFTFKNDFEKAYKNHLKDINKKSIKYGQELNEEGLLLLNRMGDNKLEPVLKHLKQYDTIFFAVSIFAPLGLGVDTESSLLILGIEFDRFLELRNLNKEEVINDQINLFKNLGDSTRFKIFCAIGKGIRTNAELAKECGVTKPTVSYHLNNMMFDGMIEFLDDVRYYSVDKKRVIDILSSFIAEVEMMQ